MQAPGSCEQSTKLVCYVFVLSFATLPRDAGPGHGGF